MSGLEKLRHIEAHHSGRNHAEIRERGITATDARDATENFPEFIALGDLLHLGAGIGDGNELTADSIGADFRFHALEEILLKNVRFERAAGFAGNDAERFLEVECFLDGFDLYRFGGIENVHFREAGHLAECQAHDLRTEARATHAEYNRMLELALLYFRV